MRARALLLSLLVIGLLVPSMALAQSGTQSVLTGQVVDKDGKPMPGVTVTAHSAKSAMQPAGTVTDADGRYRLSPLRPSDDYVLVSELPGFAKVEISPIDLDPGKTTTQNITLVPSSETTEKVTIVAKGDIVDVASTKTATVFNSEFIEGLPIIGRTYQDILTLAPGVTDTDGDGNPNVNGARATDFQTRVDGVNTTDPVTGTFGQNLNLESIAEIEVITTGASAEFSQAQGGFANIITKSGGNEFEGSFKFFFRSDLFDNDGANNSDIFPQNSFGNVDGFKDLRPFLTVGGPIVKDKLWYFASLQYINTETPVNTLTDTVKQTQEGWNNFGKLTYQPNPSHRLSWSLNWDPRTFEGLGLGTGVDRESDFTFDQGGYNTTASWTYNISPSLLLEVKAARLDTSIDVTPVTTSKDNPDCDSVVSESGDVVERCNPFTADLYTIDNAGNRVTGPFFSRTDDSRSRNTLRADLSIFVEGFGGTHNIKTGFEYADEGYELNQNIDTFVVEDLIRGGGGLTGGGGGGSDVSGTVAFFGNYPSAFGGVGCVPTGSGLTETCQEVPQLEATKDNYGFYVQDSFKPRPNLTLNVGLRFDREDAETDGFSVFEPDEEAAEFLDLLIASSSKTFEEIFDDPSSTDDKSFGQVYAEQLAAPAIEFDLNGDGRDFGHCNDQFQLDRYNNSLVTGFTINDNGSYTLVGDETVDADGNGIPDLFEGDGVDEDFFNFIDGGGGFVCQGGEFAGEACDPANNTPSGNLVDCPFSDTFGFPCIAGPDGTATFDPSLTGQTFTTAGGYGDLSQSDQVFFDPAGGQGSTDNDAANPNCDRLSADTAYLFQVFSRHQLDLVEGPVDFPAPIPGYDNGCFNALGDDGLPLPGTCRSAERFNVTNNNLAPRISVSWDPWANNKTKVFATWSRFYDKIFLSALVPELGPDPRAVLYDASQIEAGKNAQPFQTGRFSTTQVDRDLKTPFVDEFTIGFERELAPEWSIGVTYVNRDGRDQLQDVDLNHFVQDANGDGILDDAFGSVGQGTNDPSGDGGGGGSTGTTIGSSNNVRAPDDQPDLFGWNPLFNQVLRVGNFNVSDFISWQVILTRRLSRQWQMQASYVWSEAKGDAEAFQQALGNDPGTVEDEFGFLSFDQTHVVKFNAVTFLPGEQSVGASIQWSSGLPYSEIRVRNSGDNFDSFFLRTTYPTEQRNDQRNEGRWNVDLNYRKNFTFGKYHAALGIEVSDLLNSDDLRITAVDNTRFLGLNAFRDFGRRWQLSLEFNF